MVAAVATVLAVVVGFAMGWILSRTNVPGRAAFEQLMALPYYVTPLMGALAWALIGSPSSGFVNQLWRALGGEGHLIDINTPWGIAWVMALFEGSVAFVMIGAVMKSMDPAMEEASQVLGAGRMRTMLRITLPLVLPGVLGRRHLRLRRDAGLVLGRAGAGAPRPLLRRDHRHVPAGVAVPAALSRRRRPWACRCSP